MMVTTLKLMETLSGRIESSIFQRLHAHVLVSGVWRWITFLSLNPPLERGMTDTLTRFCSLAKH